MTIVPQDVVISRLKAGETLRCTLPRGNDETDRPHYSLSGGGTVHTKTYTKLKEHMRPVSAGLFEELEPQEWGWADE